MSKGTIICDFEYGCCFRKAIVHISIKFEPYVVDVDVDVGVCTIYKAGVLGVSAYFASTKPMRRCHMYIYIYIWQRLS